jgi:hypothetical protein
LVLDYAVVDGGSDATQVLQRLDGASMLAGHGLASGQAVNLLTELSVGPHTFEVEAVDSVGNRTSSSVTFSVVVTTGSIKRDIEQFVTSGAIAEGGVANSLLVTLNAAASASARGKCTTAAGLYEAFIHKVQAQSGKHIDASAAAVMIADAEYLVSHCQ